MGNPATTKTALFAIRWIVLAAVALSIPLAASAQLHYRDLRTFGTDNPDGRTPSGPAILGQDGWLYGATREGGKWDKGIVYRAAADGSGHEILRDLGTTEGDAATPESALVMGSNQLLYGTTAAGGANGLGTIYSISRDGSQYAVIHSFSGSTDGSRPVAELLIGSDGLLYGTASVGGSWGGGTLFRMAPDGTGFTVLHHFGSTGDDGKFPRYAVIELADGFLYGTTDRGGAIGAPGLGTIYRISRDGAAYTILRKFGGTSGSADIHLSGLAQADNGKLFGTTTRGGDYDYGTLFRMSADGSDFETLHHFRFTGTPGQDGAYPTGHMVSDGNGTLIGTTAAGGRNNGGTVYRISEDGTGYSVICSFNGSNHEVLGPVGLNRTADGTLYVTGSHGGIAHFPGHGGVARLNPDGSDYFLVTAFRLRRGEAAPGTGLVRDEAGKLYGILPNGGVEEVGSIYSINPDGTGYQTLHSFNGIDGDGRHPNSRLILSADGFIYGTTSDDGTSGGAGRGTIYRIAPDGMDYTVIFRFGLNNDEAYYPHDLTERPGGYLYGNALGGPNGRGVRFRVKKDGSDYQVLLDYGALPESSPQPGGGPPEDEGFLYGTALAYPSGSTYNLYRVSPDGVQFEILCELTGLSPRVPAGELIGDGTRTLFGMAKGWTIPSPGLIYSVATDGNGFQIIHEFGGYPTDGREPNYLILTAGGQLAGTTRYGGAYDSGVAFLMDRDGDNYRLIRTFGGSGEASAEPTGAFLEGEPSVFYGGAGAGGPWNLGALFRLGSVLRFESSEMTTPSVRRYTMHGDANLQYRIESAPNVETSVWTPLEQQTVGPDGKLFFNDSSGDEPFRFYRFIPEP